MFGWLDKFGPYHKKFYTIMIWGVLTSIVFLPVRACFFAYAFWLHVQKDGERAKLGDYDWERWSHAAVEQREVWIRNVLADEKAGKEPPEPWMEYWLKHKR